MHLVQPAAAENVEEEDEKQQQTPSNGGDRLRIVESCLPETSKSPKIVESPLPGGSVIVRHPPPPLPDAEEVPDGAHSEPEVVILPPPATSQPIAKVAVRSDLTRPADCTLSSEVR